MKIVSLDIETIPSKNASTFFSEIKKYRAPSNYVNPDKIAEYILDSQKEDTAKAGLHWYTGEICAISMIKVTEDKHIYFYTGKKFDRPGTIWCKSEKELLTKFFEMCTETCAGYHFIGKNYVTFDKPFITGRALAHDLGLIEPFRVGMPRDVDDIFGFSFNNSQRGTLDAYAFGMGIDTKEFDGSQVRELYETDQTEKLYDYCHYDTQIVAEMVRRYWRNFGIRNDTTPVAKDK